MNRKILALILALAAVVVVLALSLNNQTPAVDDPGVETTDDAPNMPGVEDSIFDDEPVETQKPAETNAPDTNDAPDATAEDPNALEDDPPFPEGGNAPTQGTESDQPSETEPTVTEPAQTEPVQIPEGEIDYETFTAMDPALQRAYMESFESMDAFFEWYNAAKEAYEQEHPSIDVGDGIVDLEELVGQEP